ncbi:NAD-dependent succinate-semialdehyde dehydrogenase [Helicobacter burdigaliensis]|uniref:NAD-dependent succinate-semialdehyde dehydrogenase n=1 Tax=Helicobacter burdigaliensis TaxID=2315334 RepID=UPI000EF6C2A0|nr:NAD-dependent succinate-semialdehyde dehydrogenase [Helicobacter burdigaliensis]
MRLDIFSHPHISKEPKENYYALNNPATLQTIAYIKKTNKEELEEMCKRASLAQTKWASELVEKRSDILYKFYELILEYKEDLAQIMTLEQGKVLAESRGEILYAASFVKWFSQIIRGVCGDVLLSKKENENLIVLKEPIGVCAAITPWNFPSSMITRKMAPALASGCAMVLKSASQTPLSAYALELLAQKAGIPKDLFVVVNGNAEEISDVFAKSSIIRKLSFTGSTEIGKKLYAKSAESVKKLSLELGGNAPLIVFNDADIEVAIEGIMASKFRNSGQTCVCANRIYAQSGIYEELCKRLALKISSLKVGNGMEEGVNQGPLIDEKALKKVEDHIEDALSKGAKVLSGGKRHSLGGNFYEPTLLVDVNEKMLVAKEETFGPLAPIFKFESEEEAIERANNTEFGLASYFFTQDYKRQWRVARALEYGMVGINTGIISNEVAPFGGVKQSGLGREGSKYGIEEYLEIKYLCMSL